MISRYQGEKKTGSLPFTLWVNANDRRGTSLRMGGSVAVPANTSCQGGVAAKCSFTYRSVGTNIDSTAESLDEGRFIRRAGHRGFAGLQRREQAREPAVAGMPAFQSFSSSMTVILKDGQSAQYTTATDKISGEVIKVECTLNDSQVRVDATPESDEVPS